jgi:hypothetical protein
MSGNLEAAIKEANSALPNRKLKDLIERTNLSADMKALLSDIATITAKVAGKLISIGRKILTVVFDLIKLFPAITVGVIAALVLTAIIAAIPLVGGVLAGALSSILLLLGIGKGALTDLSSPDLNERIQNFVNSLSALKEV